MTSKLRATARVILRSKAAKKQEKKGKEKISASVVVQLLLLLPSKVARMRYSFSKTCCLLSEQSDERKRLLDVLSLVFQLVARVRL